MVRKSVRVGFTLGLLAAIVLILARLAQARRDRDEDWTAPPAPEWPPIQPPPVTAEEPAPTVAAPARSSRTAGRRRRPRSDESWVEGVGSGCPPSHPVKAKLSSMLFHLPGMAAYARTTPDRCYLDAAAAESDGFTRAKR